MALSKHQILQEKYENFDSFERAVESIESTKEKGDAFEWLVYFYLLTNKAYYQIDQIYHQDIIPTSIKDTLKLELSDYGVDGVFVKQDGSITAYQAKFRSGRRSPSNNELATFYAEAENADVRLVVANTESLPHTSGKRRDHQEILIDTFLSLDSNFFEAFHEFIVEDKVVESTNEKYTPLDYQESLLNDLVTGFEENDRGKLIAACGIGKTLIGMWLHEQMNSETVLFIVPNLALIKQTIKSWSEQANHPFSYIAVCSDDSVADLESDNIVMSTSELDFSVTTNADHIAEFLNSDNQKKIVFSTYHSLDAIVNSVSSLDHFSFDLAIFDESHRTAGTKDSNMFIYAMKDEFIPINKRLFMTATERLVSPRIINSLTESSFEIFSMDNEKLYGPTLASLNFGEAIDQNIIADYKIVLCAINNEEMEYIYNNNLAIGTEIGEESIETTFDTMMKQVLVGKVMNELEINKIISYHSLVKNANLFANGGSGIAPLSNVVDNVVQDQSASETFVSHVNGTMSAGTRESILNEFSNSTRGIVSNAKCLTEGVDVPVVDGVYFVDPKKSLVDIVQAVGRALRKPYGVEQKTSYIVIPIITPENTNSFDDIPENEFTTLHNVIQAMRAQDHNLADEIDEINMRTVTGATSGGNGGSSKFKLINYSDINIEDFSNSISLRIADVNRNPDQTTIIENIEEHTPNARRSSMNRVFKTIGDYNLDTYLNNLLLPVLEKFDSTSTTLNSDQIKVIVDNKVNHNTTSHGKRMGIINENNKLYTMTSIGAQIKNNPNLFNKIVQEQMLKYYYQENNQILFPYRALFKIFLELDTVSRFEFLFSIYSLKNTEEWSIQEAINRINELRETYPNINLVGRTTQENIINILNNKYETSFSYQDVWTSRTTVYNQYNYFKKHLLAFDDIFINSSNRQDNNIIKRDPNSTDRINNLLEATSSIEVFVHDGNLVSARNLFTSPRFQNLF